MVEHDYEHVATHSLALPGLHEAKMRPPGQLVILSSLVAVSIVVGCSGNAGRGIANANRLNTYELMMAAAETYKAGRIEDAGFLFLAGQARYQIDKQVFPPVAQGGDSPGVLKAALSATIGQAIQPALANDPIAFANAVSRFAKWSPDFGNGYDPGWKYQNRLGDQATAAVVSATLKPVLASAQSKAKLIQNDEYAKLSQVIKESGAVERKHSEALQSSGGKVPEDLQKQYRAAMERKNAAARRMKEIEFDISPETRWHTTAGWNAENYFDDPRVIKLCQAIERNDIPEMERLIAAGADVDAVGKGGMTPLLWAFPDRKLERFRCLLEHGANPNVTIESDFGVRNRPLHPYPAGGSFYNDRGCPPGQSVTHLAARSPEVEYLKLVLTHRGNPNVVDKKTGMTPLDIVNDRSYFDARQRVELLVAKGADVNHYCQYKGGTPAMLAVLSDKFDTALFLLQSGADPRLFRPDGTEKLVHFVVQTERRLVDFPPQLVADYRALVEWLEKHGESLEEARADQKSWDKRFTKAMVPEDHARIRQQIIGEQNRGNRPEAASLDSAISGAGALQH